MEYFTILYHLKMNNISILLLINSQVKEVDSFLIVYKYKDRFTRPFKRTLTMLTKMFGNFWTNVVIVVNFWSFKKVNMLNDMCIFGPSWILVEQRKIIREYFCWSDPWWRAKNHWCYTPKVFSTINLSLRTKIWFR